MSVMEKKQTLVILPGWGGSHATWQEFIALASGHFDVHCIDLPCFGSESCPEAVWGVGDYSVFVRTKIEERHLRNIILLGHSFGGQVAVHFTAQNPKLVHRLVLSGAAVIRPKRVVRRMILKSLARGGVYALKAIPFEKFKLNLRRVFYRLIDSPDYLATRGIQREIYTRIIREDCSHLLAGIRVPTLVLWGAKDRMTPLSQGKRIAALLPSASMRIFPKAGHGLHRELTREFYRSIREFV